MINHPIHLPPPPATRLRRSGSVRSKMARLLVASATAAAAIAQPTASIAMDLATPLACPSAAARPVQVCFALDASGSIGSRNFSDMKSAIAKAVSAASSVPQDGSVSLSFVMFGDAATLQVPMTKVDSPATANQIASLVQGLPYVQGATAIGDAISLCTRQFTMAPGQRHIINVVTDSVEIGYTGMNVVTARNYAIDRGVNVINGLGIGTTDAVVQGLKRFVWPSPASTFPADGFAALITDWAFVPEGIAGMMSASTFTISSSGPATALPVTGPLSDQLTRLNGTPPAYNPTQWSRVYRKSDVRVSRAFRCQEVADPLDRNGTLKLGYVSADTPMPGVDEVTYNNCTSAFYRFTFALPKGIKQICLNGRANVDDIARVSLNGQPMSPAIFASDLQKDRTDDTGRPAITWPTQDQFGVDDKSWFRMGAINELVFAVAGDVSIEPTGVEFRAKIAALTIPVVTSFAINRGASSTTSRTVTLYNTASEQPTHYMASESSDFIGAAWLPYSATPRFELSAGAGLHTVHLRFRGANGRSTVWSDSIELR